MRSLLLAAGMGMTGAATALVTSVAQAAGGAGSDLAPYLSGGSSAVAVAGVVMGLRKALAGDIIAKPVAEYQREQALMLATVSEINDKVMQLTEKTVSALERQTKQQGETAELLWRVNSHLGGPDERRKSPRRST